MMADFEKLQKEQGFAFGKVCQPAIDLFLEACEFIGDMWQKTANDLIKQLIARREKEAQEKAERE